jgi:hypothetical protein
MKKGSCNMYLNMKKINVIERKRWELVHQTFWDTWQVVETLILGPNLFHLFVIWCHCLQIVVMSLQIQFHMN